MMPVIKPILILLTAVGLLVAVVMIESYYREHHNAKRLPCIKTEIGE